jgi:hypothetical protein
MAGLGGTDLSKSMEILREACVLSFSPVPPGTVSPQGWQVLPEDLAQWASLKVAGGSLQPLPSGQIFTLRGVNSACADCLVGESVAYS